MKNNRRKDSRPKALRRQRDVLCDVMLSAGACETWLTLVELSHRLSHAVRVEGIAPSKPREEGSHGAAIAVCSIDARVDVRVRLTV
jgi:hypothetical protein